MLFPRQANYSLFILLMESALGLCQNSKRVRHAIRIGRNLGDSDEWHALARGCTVFAAKKSKFKPEQVAMT